MPDANAAALDFLLTRRSRPAKTLTAPYPDRAALMPVLTAAARTPDHGKLEPWRFVVLGRTALDRLAGMVENRGAELGRTAEEIAKQRAQYAQSGLAVAVIGCPRPSEKIPQIEQMLSAGAACLQLLNAALAAGWGANWLTGWAVHDPAFAAQGLGLAPGEWVAGLVHIGTETAAPPDRPRPDLDAIVTWDPA